MFFIKGILRTNLNKNTGASKSLKEWEQSNLKITHSYKNKSYKNRCIQEQQKTSDWFEFTTMEVIFGKTSLVIWFYYCATNNIQYPNNSKIKKQKQSLLICKWSRRRTLDKKMQVFVPYTYSLTVKYLYKVIN